MSINVVVSSTAAGVSVSGGTAVDITVGGGIGPAGFITAPGTATNAFGTFQLVSGDGVTITTNAGQFVIASYSTTQAASFAPVQSVAGRTGTISLAAADVSGLAAVATSGSYTSLSEIPVEFTPATHTHDYAASVHTHSTADISGYSSLPSQAGADGPLVTDGTAATWATRYSVVDPVLVEGAGMTLSRDTAAGEITIAFAGGTSGIVVSSATPQPLGTAAAGSSGDASRADHVHAMPSAADVGAVPSVNGISSAITIAAGDNVTVSTASSTITIAAGGGGGSGGGVAMSYLFS